MRRSILAAVLALVAFAVPVRANQPCNRDHQTCPPPAPVAMGRLVTTGFEASDAFSNSNGTFTVDGDKFGTTSFDATTVRTGTTSLKAATSGSGNSWTITGALATSYFLRAYVYVPTGGLPGSGSTAIEFFLTTGNAVVAQVRLDSSGNVWIADSAGVQIGSSATFTLNIWNRVEFRVLVGTGSIDEAELRLNGTVVQASTGLALSDSAPNQADVGGVSGATAVTMYFDDVALNDSNGANQNSWPGDGAVVLLLPTADSAKGTGWTNDAAGASNFFDAVNNTPPVGIADTTGSTGLHQIRNATSNANASYDATMTSYVAAGVPNGSVINVVDPLVITGAPVTTSAKAGTVGVVSNPTIANISLSTEGTSGAFWAGFAAGTYATGWKTSHGTITYGPSVTLATAPVMRITQVTSSTRIAMVCFMAMYVDFSPPSLASSLMLNQSVQRATNW